MPRLKPDVKLEALKKLISIVDGSRIRRSCSDSEFRNIDMFVRTGKLGTEVAREWKESKRIIYKMGATIAEIPSINRLNTYRIVLDFVGVMYLMIAISFLMYEIFTRKSAEVPLIGIVILSAPILIPVFFLVPKYLELKIGKKIDEYNKQHPLKFRRRSERLKKICRNMLYALLDMAKKRKINPEEIELKLYNIDYEGIEVISKPGRLTKHYVVKLVDTSRKGRES